MLFRLRVEHLFEDVGHSTCLFCFHVKGYAVMGLGPVCGASGFASQRLGQRQRKSTTPRRLVAVVCRIQSSFGLDSVC